ncbi:hypothetical protein YTPLAS21_19040 [Candidatus Nitrosocosmicus sp.]|nr:hypothetical protein YTPLAS21_19040 [Candidatus Nitrosocosmicus sp.]
MGIKNYHVVTTGLAGVNPNIVYLDTTDTVAQVTTAGYLNEMVNALGVPLTTNMIALVSTKTTPNAEEHQVRFYDINYSGGSWSLAASSSSGTVNAGLANEIAYYASAGDTVSGLTTGARGVLVTSAAGAPSILVPAATTGLVLQSNSAGAPTFSTATYPSVATGTGTFLRADGTNWVASTLTLPNTLGINEIVYASSANVGGAIAAANGGVLVSSAAGVPSMLANPTATGRILTSVNADAPVWSAMAFPTTVGNLNTMLRSDGTDWVASVPTYANTYAVNTMLYAGTADVVTGLAAQANSVLSAAAAGVPTWIALTDGQLLVGSTAGAPIAANITAGSGISVVNGANSITIATVGTAGITWQNAGASPITAAVNNGYVSDDAGATTFNLPATFAQGDVIEIIGEGAGGWVVVPNAGDSIRMGTSTTAVSVTSANQYDSVKLIGKVANSEWAVVYAVSAGLTFA